MINKTKKDMLARKEQLIREAHLEDKALIDYFYTHYSPQDAIQKEVNNQEELKLAIKELSPTTIGKIATKTISINGKKFLAEFYTSTSAGKYYANMILSQIKKRTDFPVIERTRFYYQTANTRGSLASDKIKTTTSIIYPFEIKNLL